MKINVLSAIIAVAIFGALNQSVYAAGNAGYGQYGQYGQYGAPGAAPKILIDKTVGGGTTKGGQQSFVDNLSPSDPRFAPGATVTFQLKVKNTTDEQLSKVTVNDLLPGTLDYVSGGALRSDGTIVIDGGDFKPNQEKTFTVVARVKSQDRLPADRGVICEINKAEAVAANTRDEDTAQFCIEKQVAGVPGAPKEVKNVPEAGPAGALGILLANIATLATGIFIKRKTA